MGDRHIAYIVDMETSATPNRQPTSPHDRGGWRARRACKQEKKNGEKEKPLTWRSKALASAGQARQLALHRAFSLPGAWMSLRKDELGVLHTPITTQISKPLTFTAANGRPLTNRLPVQMPRVCISEEGKLESESPGRAMRGKYNKQGASGQVKARG